MSPSLISHSHTHQAPRSNTLVFPQETFELIIDELRDSTAALASCSLVRRSWLPRSRHQLYRHVELNVADPDAVDTGLEAAHPADGRQNAPLAHLSRALSSHEFSTSFSNPNIVACVRGLSLSITTPQNLSSSSNQRPNHCHFDCSIPSTIPFTQLRSLSLRCGDIEILDTKDTRLKRLMAIVRCNPYIEHVSLHTMQIDGAPWQMVLSCIAVRAKALKALIVNRVGDVHWRSGWVEGRINSTSASISRHARDNNHLPSSKSKTQHFLERVYLAGCSPSKIDYVARQFELCQVRSLALLDNDPSSCLDIMRRCSDSLSHLSIDIGSNAVRDYIQGTVFEKLSGISVLQIFLSKVEDLEVVLQILTSTSHRARRLHHLYLDFHELPATNCPRLSAPQAVLSKFLHSVPSVKKIVVSVGAVALDNRRNRLFQRESKRVDLRYLFPALIQRGIVELGSPEEWWKVSGV